MFEISEVDIKKIHDNICNKTTITAAWYIACPFMPSRKDRKWIKFTATKDGKTFTSSMGSVRIKKSQHGSH